LVPLFDETNSIVEFKTLEPERNIDFDIADSTRTIADEQLVNIAPKNFVSNATKFTSAIKTAKIVFVQQK